MRRTLPNRFWIALLASVFIVCAAMALLLARSGPAGAVARIAVDGETVRVIDLSAVTAESRFTLETPGGVNVIAVRPGGICVVEADCPDGVCVRQGWLTGGRMPIVCLPHRLTITLESGEAGADGFDVISG